MNKLPIPSIKTPYAKMLAPLHYNVKPIFWRSSLKFLSMTDVYMQVNWSGKGTFILFWTSTTYPAQHFLIQVWHVSSHSLSVWVCLAPFIPACRYPFKLSCASANACNHVGGFWVTVTWLVIVSMIPFTLLFEQATQNVSLYP